MTDTITREHVEAAEAALRATVARLNEERESEARQFTEKKRNIVLRGREAANENSIGSRFDDMMEEIGLPRRPQQWTVQMTLVSLMPTLPEQRITYGSGTAVYSGEHVLVTVDHQLVAQEGVLREGDTCLCDSAAYHASRWLDRYYGVADNTPTAAGAQFQINNPWCRNPDCPNHRRYDLPRGLQPGLPVQAYIPEEPEVLDL